MAGTGTVTVTILGNATHLKSTLDDVDSSLGSKLGNIGDKFEAVGRKMTTHLTLPIVGGLGLAVKAFGDFEQQLNTFKAVSGATTDEMARISQLAKDLGKDVTLPGTSAKDAADAMTELAKAGLSVNDTMAASKGVLQLSAAAQIGNADAATLTATALNSFGLKGADAIRVADILAATANASSAEITDVGLAMSQASAVFSAANIPVEDLSTAIGLMANNGIKGSDAGTSLKSAMLALQTPSKQQAGIMKEIGFSLYDSSGKMKSMRDIVGNLETSFAGMTQQQRDSNLGILLGSDAIRTGNILLKEGVEGWDEMKGSVTKGGAAAEVAGAKMKGVKGSIEALKSNVETLAISVGEKLAPFLTAVAAKLNFLVDAFGTLSPGVQNVALVVLGLVAAIGPLIWIMGALISASATWTIAMEFLAANPIVLVIAGIVALVAALVYAYTHFEGFRDLVNSVARYLVDTIGPLVGAFKEYVLEQFKNLVDWVKTFWPQVSEAIGHVMVVIRETVQVVLGVVAALWRAWGDDIWNVVKTYWNFIRETIENAIQLIKGILQTVVALINGDWGAAWEGIKNIVGAVWDQIGNIISTAVGVLRSAVSGVLTEIVGFFTGLGGRIAGAAGDFLLTIRNQAESAKDWIQGKVNEIVGFFLSIPSRIANVGRDILSKLIPDLPGAGVISGVISHIPGFATGGVVPGPFGAPMLAMVHGGETILPPGSGGGVGGTTVVTFNVAVTAIDPAAAQEAVIAAIKEFERRNGAGWRAA